VFEIGNSLREARLRQGLEFPEIEQATKIRGKYLRALEEEQFEVLPAQTYVKGFLRSYADYLGLDGQLYVDEFNSRYVRGEIEDAQGLEAQSRQRAPEQGGDADPRDHRRVDRVRLHRGEVGRLG
jgi:cytoskeletal protein RodZ